MKKTAIVVLALVLVIAMFSGCRRRNDQTTGTTAEPTTTNTTRATLPQTTGSLPGSTGVIPGATDIMPDMTDGTDMTRSHRGPRY